MKKLAQFKWPILFAVIGIALNIGAVVSLVDAFGNSGTPILAPGETKVIIAKPGDYTLWHETKTMIDGQFKTFPDDLPSEATIKVLKQPEGTSVQLRRSGSSSVESNGTRRISLGQLTFTSPGAYKVIVLGLPEKHLLYLDEAKFVKAFLSVMICGGFGILFLFAALGSGIFVLTQRSKGGR
ncbi:MAG: hypothetical protein JWM68_4501 [Verrucomicrobiales bacterium]|nr:hypothetical protein [Verrucomicrobiales bacterium]